MALFGPFEIIIVFFYQRIYLYKYLSKFLFVVVAHETQNFYNLLNQVYVKYRLYIPNRGLYRMYIRSIIMSTIIMLSWRLLMTHFIHAGKHSMHSILLRLQAANMFHHNNILVVLLTDTRRAKVNDLFVTW